MLNGNISIVPLVSSVSVSACASQPMPRLRAQTRLRVIARQTRPTSSAKNGE